MKNAGWFSGMVCLCCLAGAVPSLEADDQQPAPEGAPGTAVANPEQANAQQAMKDFVVSGEDKLKVRSEKLLRLLFVDVDKPIQEIMMQSSELSQRILPDKALEAYERAAMVSDSHMTFSPWLTLITKQPILVIKPQRVSLEIKSWKFTISDETGNVLYTRAGGSDLPEQLVWDGFCQDGRLIGVGESFYYSITLVDKADNPLFTTSKPRKLSSLAYYQDNRLKLSLLLSILFDEKMRSDLSILGKSLLTETCDYLIKDMGRSTVIEISTTNPKLGQAQGEKIRDFIVEKLAVPADDFKINLGVTTDPLLERVDISAAR